MAAFFKLGSLYDKVAADVVLPANGAEHFNIIRVEDIHVAKDKPMPYSRRDYYKVSLVTGHSKIYYADRRFEISGTTLVFTNPMIPYVWEPISDLQTGYVCIFTGTFFADLVKLQNFPVYSSAENAIITLGEQDAALFEHQFKKLVAELEGNYAYKDDLLRSLLTGLIHEAQKLQPAFSKPTLGATAYERITVLFNELQERQYPVNAQGRLMLTSASAFAACLNIHVNHLNKALKDVTGSSTSQLISNRMLQEAKMLLKNDTQTVSEIAWALGFDEPNHFSAFFKKQTGTSPTQFRAGLN
ncbi:helix-turn-helix domain-containing protein [Mucilaginibacter sp. CAU 1740]|uniref:helix-turn-helix domain-containing protein n=1 Tax=Mucilaginibacter sp. CAU 1740 TaxID=3140365 RepID=UPI00325A6EB1